MTGKEMNEIVKVPADPLQVEDTDYPSLLFKVRSMMSDDESKCGLAYPDINDEGRAIATQANILLFLHSFGINVCYDEFALKTYVFGVPKHTLLDDDAFDDIFVAMDMTGLRVGKDLLWPILGSYARNIRAHPVREKLAHLGDQWDGNSRLDTWLIDYCGVEDTPYTRAVAGKWMIAAARRVRHPGCKFDHVLIFEGPQGTGKSTVFRTLAFDDWFTDNLTIGLDPKEVIELTRGKWICELAELTNLGKRDVEAVKAFVTRQIDEARKAYGRETQSVPRQFVLAATTNRARYLRDESGDRRFWMVQTKGVIDTGMNNLPLMLDIEGLRAVRDQLWAEAAVREAKGEEIYLSHEIEALARVEQAKRFDADDRQQLLEDLLEGKSGFAHNDELYRAIGFTETRDKHPGVTKLVTAALTRLGWMSDRLRIGPPPMNQHRGWFSPDESDNVIYFSETGGLVSGSRERYLVELKDRRLAEARGS